MSMSIIAAILNRARKDHQQLFLCGIVVTVLFSLFYIFKPSFFHHLELRFYDTVLSENPIDKPASDVIIVDIDEISLKQFGQWPWPRDQVARLLKKVKEYGASVIGVDLLFAEPDRTSLSAIIRHIQENYGYSPQIENAPPGSLNNDHLLAETLRSGPFVLAKKFFFDEKAVNSNECLLHPLPIAIFGLTESDSDNKPFHRASGVVCNLPIFDNAVTANGFINAPFDIDGLIRRIPLIIRYGPKNQSQEYFPSLVLATVMKQMDVRQVSVNMHSGKPSTIQVGNIAIPVDGIGNMLIHYRDKAKAFPYVSAADILNDSPMEASLAGKVVFVGTSATGLGETRTTPVDPFLHGVEIHATAAQNILQSNFILRPSWMPGLELFFVFLTGVLSTVLLTRTNAKWSLLLVLAIAIAIWFIPHWVFRYEKLFVSSLVPLLTVVANFSVLNLFKFWKSEQALRFSESKYRSIFDHAVEGIYQVTPDGKLITANRSLAHMMGFEDPSDMLAAMPHVRSISFETPDALPQMRRILSEAGAVRNFETKIITSKGTQIWVSINANAISNDQNELLYEGSIEDISDRKRSDEDLQESRRRLMDIIEFLPDATLVIDKDGKVIAWNRAMETMTGVKKEDMLGKGDYEYALPFYGERRPLLLDLAMSRDREPEKHFTNVQRVGGILFSEFFTPTLPSGGAHLYGTASVLQNSKGEIIAAIECLRDHTEQKRMEERLSRAEKMEALGTLAGGVAHDLNNVLGVLVGYSELLAENLPEGSSTRRYAESIMQSSIRGAAIIQDLLTLARRGVSVSEVLCLNTLIRDYLQTPEFENLKYSHPQVRILTELEDGLLKIKGSSIHLSKAVMNLVLNSAEAISGQGEVTIRTENRYLDRPIQGYDGIQEGDYAVLTVSDTGTGISPGDLSKIFEPFYTKKVMGKSGTGLGLAVVWGTVKDHNGYIDVQSEEGKGSTFILYFPVTRDAPAEAEKHSHPDVYMGRGETILVVDDVKEQRELAISMLGSIGYQVEAVASGEEAVEYIKSKKADLVMLDMIMDPGIDGMETYRRILEINPLQRAVIASGFSETDRVRKAQEIGAGAFVRKPFVLENIGLAVRGELDRQ